ncbi:MAG: DUF5518 domain-containing protein [Halobacteriaceae archaeon]
MHSWRAIGFGVAVAAVLSFTGVLVPLVGHAMVGVAGGLAAGVLAGGGASDGARNGALVGVAAAALLTVLAVLIGFDSSLATVLESSVAAMATIYTRSTPVLVVTGAAITILAAVAGGGIGGAIRGETPLPSVAPEDRRG